MTDGRKAAKNGYHHGDLRAALVSAAVEVIEDLGPSALTIREVAKRAGVSHAAPYRHFADKSELITAVVERGFELLNEAMLQAETDAGEDSLARFAASGDAYIQFGLTYPAYYRVMFSGDLLNKDGQASLQHTSSAAIEQLKETLSKGQKLGIVASGDPLLQALWITSAVHGYISLANDGRINYLTGDKYSDAQIKDFIMAAIYRGLTEQE